MAITFQWNSTGPIGAEQVLSAPTVASKGKGQMDVFVVGPDSQVWTKWWSYEGGYKWSDWGFLGGGWHHSAPAVASKADGQLDLFITGDDNTMYFKYYSRTGGWNPSYWAAVGNGFYGSPGIARTAPGQDTLIAPDQHQNLAFKTIAPGLNSNWYYLQDGFVVVDAAACTSNLLLARNPNDSHVHVKSMIGTPWGPDQSNPWNSIGGYLASAPSAFTDGSGNVFVFGQDNDNTLWANIYDTAANAGKGAWQDWVQIGDVITSAPAAVSKDTGQVDVFFRGADGKLWCKSGFIGYANRARAMEVTDVEEATRVRRDPDIAE